jgi:hypothetical protein
VRFLKRSNQWDRGKNKKWARNLLGAHVKLTKMPFVFEFGALVTEKIALAHGHSLKNVLEYIYILVAIPC